MVSEQKDTSGKIASFTASHCSSAGILKLGVRRLIGGVCSNGSSTGEGGFQIANGKSEFSSFDQPGTAGAVFRRDHRDAREST